MPPMLTSSIAKLSSELREFAQRTASGIGELKRELDCEPHCEASLFREECEHLAKQAAAAQSEVSALHESIVVNFPLEELLTQCVQLYHDSQARIKTLEGHLRQYGYVAECADPAPDSPLKRFLQQQVPQEGCGDDSTADNSTAPHEHHPEQPGAGKLLRLEKPAMPPFKVEDVDSPELALDQLHQRYSQGTSEGRRLTVTPAPSPAASSSPSAMSLSPAIRVLQRKYGEPASASRLASAACGSAADRREDNSNHVLAPGCEPDNPVEKAPKSNSSSSEDAAPAGSAPIEGAGPLPRTPAPVMPPVPAEAPPRVEEVSYAGSEEPARTRRGSMRPAGGMAIALAVGEAPWDMLSLKAAINAAQPGTGQIARILGATTFQPQAAAFTALLHMCAKAKLWQKALEVFEGMRAFHPAVRPNTVHYSSLISACATAGRWEEAMRVFADMKAAGDPACAPNVITYSALMTACCAGGRPDAAAGVFAEMRAAGIQPDHISYSTLIAGFERNGELERARAIFEDMQAAGLAAKPPAGMAKLPSYLEQFSRKLSKQALRGDEMDMRADPAALAALSVGSPSHGWGAHTRVDSPQDCHDVLGASAEGIKAHYGGTDGNGQFWAEVPPQLDAFGRPSLGLGSYEPTLELRREVLHTRSPSPMDGGMRTLPPGAGLLCERFGGAPLLGQSLSTPAPHAPPAFGEARTPSTAELLRAAHTGSAASCGAGGQPVSYPPPPPLAPSFFAEMLPNAASLPMPMGRAPPPRAASPKAQQGPNQGQACSPGAHRPSNLGGVPRPAPVAPAFSLFSARPQGRPVPNASRIQSPFALHRGAAGATVPSHIRPAGPLLPGAAFHPISYPAHFSPSRSLPTALLAPGTGPGPGRLEGPSSSASSPRVNATAAASMGPGHRPPAMDLGGIPGTLGELAMSGTIPVRQHSAPLLPDLAVSLSPGRLGQLLLGPVPDPPPRGLSPLCRRPQTGPYTLDVARAGPPFPEQVQALSSAWTLPADGLALRPCASGALPASLPPVGADGRLDACVLGGASLATADSGHTLANAHHGSVEQSAKAQALHNSGLNQPYAAVTPEEFAALPLRLSRQATLEQLNSVLSLVHWMVQGQAAGSGAAAEDLGAAELGPQRTNAALHCLLHLQRVRLAVRGGRSLYVPAT